MKILFLLQDIPYPISDGMRWKVFYLLQYMSQRHQCDVLAFSDRATEVLGEIENVLPSVRWIGVLPKPSGVNLAVKALFMLLKGKPISFARFNSRAYSQRLTQVLKETTYDVVHYDIINMAQYLVSDVPSVHSPNDATSLFYERMAGSVGLGWEYLRLKLGAKLLGRYERLQYPRFSCLHVVSHVDAEYLCRQVPGAHVKYIPFGVVCKAINRAPLPQSGGEMSPLVLVLGGANMPGVALGIEHFVEEIAPRIKAKVPSARIRIQGRGTDVLLARIDPENSRNLEVSTWVEDLDALIQSAAIVVLPDVTGTGIKTRALQAFGNGVAVVGTSVALEGLGNYVTNGKHCLIVDSIADLEGALCELLLDSDRRASLGNNATKLISEHLSWDVLGPIYEEMYSTVAHERSNQS